MDGSMDSFHRDGQLSARAAAVSSFMVEARVGLALIGAGSN
jgi:hypothetical protein